MWRTAAMIIVVLLFFILVLRAIQVEEKRKGDRRKADLPHPVERRRGERRKGSASGFLAFALRSLRARLRS